MTVPSTTRRAGPFTGTGALTSYPFTFKVFAAADLAVTVADPDGLESTLVLDSSFLVTLNGDQETTPGGSVQYAVSGIATALPAGYSLAITGEGLEYEQTADLPQGGNFNPVVIENALDRQMMLTQLLRDVVTRALQLSVTTPDGVDATLPTPVANNFIGWDSGGVGLRNIDPNTLATVVAFASWQSETFNGTGAQTQFTLAADPGSIANTDVSVGGVTQRPNIDYTLSGLVVTFTVAPYAATNNILVRYGQALPEGTSTLETQLAATTWLTPYLGSLVRTAKEITAGVVPTNYAYGPNGSGAYDIRRYGCACDGATDDTVAWDGDVEAVVNAGQPVFIPAGLTTVYRGFGVSLGSGARVYGPGTIKFDPSAAGYVGVFHTGNIYSEVNPARSDIIIDGVRFYSVKDQEYLHFIGIRNRGGSLTDVVVKNCVFRYEATSHTGSDRWAISLGGSVGTTHTRIYILRNECYGKMQLTAGGQGANWQDTYIDDNISIGGYVAGIALTRLDTGAASSYKRIYIRRNELYLPEGNLGVYLGPDTDSGSPEEQNWEDIFIEQNAIFVTNPAGGSGVFFRKPQTGSVTRVSIKGNTIYATTAVNLGEHNSSTVTPTACYVSENLCTRGDVACSWGGVTFSKNEMVDDVRVIANVSIRLIGNTLRGLRMEQSCTAFSNRNTYQMSANNSRGINVNSPAANTVVLTSVDDTFSYVGSSGSPQCGVRVSGAGTVTAVVIKPHDTVRSGWGDNLLRFEDSKTLTFYEPDSANFQQTFSAAQIANAANVANTSGQYKFAGNVVWDTTNNRAMRASGGNPTSTWIVVDGSATVTPV